MRMPWPLLAVLAVQAALSVRARTAFRLAPLTASRAAADHDRMGNRVGVHP
jgi:hypothetical protein